MKSRIDRAVSAELNGTLPRLDGNPHPRPFPLGDESGRRRRDALERQRQELDRRIRPLDSHDSGSDVAAANGIVDRNPPALRLSVDLIRHSSSPGMAYSVYQPGSTATPAMLAGDGTWMAVASSAPNLHGWPKGTRRPMIGRPSWRGRL